MNSSQDIFFRRFIGYCLIVFGIICILFGSSFVPAFFSGCGLGVFIGFWYSFVLFVSGWIKVRLGLDFLKRRFHYLKAGLILSVILDGAIWYYFFHLPNPFFLSIQIRVIYLLCCYVVSFFYLVFMLPIGKLAP